MGKIIRPRYSIEISIGLLLLAFALAMFLSHPLFDVHGNEEKNVYLAMFLVSIAVDIMLLVLWEEFLFPIRVKPEPGGIIFSNHRHKLNTQILIYTAIPAIFLFTYLEYNVQPVRFGIWAAICIIAPVAGKLISGIKNYNDFLRLGNDAIEYKDNKLGGTLPLTDIRSIEMIKDARTVLHKLKVTMKSSEEIIIDLDDMELDAFIVAIDKVISTQYKSLLIMVPLEEKE